jgi:hypothetical protein
MKFTDDDAIHARFMMKQQIHNVDQLIHFWILFGSKDLLGPPVEWCKPVWYHDLPYVTTIVREKNRKL